MRSGNNLAEHPSCLKARDRTSYVFALVSVAAGLELKDGQIVDARRALEAERVLRGGAPSDDLFLAAATAEMEAARPLEHNRYKVELARRLIVRALRTALAGTGTHITAEH